MRSTLPASLLTLCMLLTLGCPRGEDIRGRYEAEAGADSPAVILELNEEGKGGWGGGRGPPPPPPASLGSCVVRKWFCTPSPAAFSQAPWSIPTVGNAESPSISPE